MSSDALELPPSDIGSKSPDIVPLNEFSPRFLIRSRLETLPAIIPNYSLLLGIIIISTNESINQGEIMKSVKAILLIAALSLSLTACASGNSGPQSFSDIDGVRDAFVSSGGDCPQWNQDNRVTDALQSGTCDEETVIMFFGSEGEANARALDLKNTMKSFGITPSLLVGPNWVINSPQVLAVEQQMGGVLIAD